jgi:hypothetical protein
MDCTCQSTCTLPTCLTDLTIGTLKDADHVTDVYVYFERLGGAHRRQRLAAVVGYGGLITVDLTDLPQQFLSHTFTYKMTVTEQLYVCEPLTVVLTDGTEGTCFDLNFKNDYDGQNLTGTAEAELAGIAVPV